LDDLVITQRSDSRSPSAIGRSARLELVFAVRGGRTTLAHAYAEPPFRIGRAFAIDTAAYVIVACSGPGVFAGDTLQQSVRVERGARAVMTSQSALQIHPPPAERLPDGPGAIIRQHYHLAEDAELHCHWDPVIPFAGATLAQRFDIDLHSTSRLYWSDALMSGRTRRGEAWRFRALAHELRLRVCDASGGSLKYLERYHLMPAQRGLTRPWIAGDAHYFATTLVHHRRVTPDAVEGLHRQVWSGAQVAADLVEPPLMVARATASNGAAFAAARADIRRLALETIFQSPQLAGRK
jgi:urease accessory protein UreH